MKNVEGIIIILASLYVTIFFETKYHFQGNDGIKREKMFAISIIHFDRKRKASTTLKEKLKNRNPTR